MSTGDVESGEGAGARLLPPPTKDVPKKLTPASPAPAAPAEEAKSEKALSMLSCFCGDAAHLGSRALDVRVGMCARSLAPSRAAPSHFIRAHAYHWAREQNLPGVAAARSRRHGVTRCTAVNCQVLMMQPMFNYPLFVNLLTTFAYLPTSFAYIYFMVW